MAVSTRTPAAGLSVRARPTARIVPPSSHVADIQRARLLAGAVRAVDEFGYTRTTVTEITSKAHVSRRTFYELFANSEDCLAAMLDEMVERISADLCNANLDASSWRERVRGGLWTILRFFDREPALARVCLVQSARGGQRILERREQLLKDLVEVVDEARRERDSEADCPPLTSEGLVGAALSIVHTRLVRGDSAPLTDLHGELMAIIVLPYLGPVAARRERKRKAPVESATDTVQSDEHANGRSTQLADDHADPLQDIPIRLTYRTVCVLEAVAEQPGISNRAVGTAAGVSDQGQISKLLARLERYGLLENERPPTKGEANAWYLTSVGRQVAQVVGMSNRDARRGA